LRKKYNRETQKLYLMINLLYRQLNRNNDIYKLLKKTMKHY